MHSRIKNFTLIALTAGALIAFSAVAAEDDSAETPTTLPIKELRNFSEVFGRIKSDYVEPVTDKELLTDAIEGMLNGLDPHSAYLDADGFKELKDSTDGEFGGLGIEVDMEEGLVKVVSAIEDTPAFQAGVKSGDLIYKLDDTLVKGLTLDEAVKRMRGKPDTKITLTILRKNEAKPLVITLKRALIKVKSVKPKLAEAGYGYVRLTQFQEHTGEDLAAALKKLDQENKGELKGLVLDLRNNPGGLLNAAVGVSTAFLPKGTLVVYTDGRTEDAKMRLFATPDNYLREDSKGDYLKDLPAWIKTAPMVVLVDGGSASASEIVAGALQDHKRAVIMGTQTFGKGSVQTILPLDNNTAIKLTTARYYTPNGRSIQAKGIAPDIVAKEPGSNDTSALHLREADLERHLSNEQDDGTAAPAKEDDPQDSNRPASAPVPFGDKNDYQLNQALSLLKGINILNANKSPLP
ncbi:MAG: S41 family peptidase [Gallionellaceae bacterium]|jgi:carboxyl-terminal processing protease|nr:S41 family peptidase [Gallionellaceae bacterium]